MPFGGIGRRIVVERAVMQGHRIPKPVELVDLFEVPAHELVDSLPHVLRILRIDVGAYSSQALEEERAINEDCALWCFGVPPTE